jgi:hypothetical protein
MSDLIKFQYDETTDTFYGTFTRSEFTAFSRNHLEKVRSDYKRDYGKPLPSYLLKCNTLTWKQHVTPRNYHLSTLNKGDN